MKRILTGVLVIALTITFSVIALASNGEKTATPSQTKFIMDGKEVTFDVAYNIENSNYIQLRSVAQTLNGTTSQFNVYWDNDLRQAVIETGKPYTGVKPDSVVDLTNNPTAAQVSGAIANVSGVTDIEIVTEDHDPNGNLGKQGGYTGCLYFRSPLIPQSDLYVADDKDINSSIDCGTSGGGSIEIYATVKDAERRNEYLSNFDGGALSSGSHKVIGTLVIRTSDKLLASQQKTLETAIVGALTNGDIGADDIAPTPTPSSKPTETPASVSSYKVGDTVTMANATIRLTKVITANSTPPDEYGSRFIAGNGNTFLCISFEVTANNLNYNNTLWYPNNFIKYATAVSGINYEMPFSQGTTGFGANAKKTATVYIEFPANETVAMVVVSDGASGEAIVSVN